MILIPLMLKYASSRYAMLGLGVKSHIVWSNARIKLGWADGTRSLTVNRSVTWDPLKTIIDGAHLVVSANATTAYGSTLMVLYMNGQEVARNFWDLGGPYTARIDVTALLSNGPNVFVAEYEKNPIINPSAELNLTVTLEIASTGEEEPEVPPPPPLPWLPDWWPYAAIGIGMAIVGGVILYTKRGK